MLMLMLESYVSSSIFFRLTVFDAQGSTMYNNVCARYAQLSSPFQSAFATGVHCDHGSYLKRFNMLLLRDYKWRA